MHTPGISDSRITRQRRWQLKKVAAGLCQCCGAGKLAEPTNGRAHVFCTPCLERHNAHTLSLYIPVAQRGERPSHVQSPTSND